jgi:hypothetical protein
VTPQPLFTYEIARLAARMPWMVPLSVAAAVALLLLGSALAIPLFAGPSEAQTEPESRSTRRCPECGWIVAKRDIASGADNRSIRIQEYTVRMIDGSSRVFTGGPSDRWRLGEPLKFIDGEQ